LLYGGHRLSLCAFAPLRETNQTKDLPEHWQVSANVGVR
jgi:hypothetical protein